MTNSINLCPCCKTYEFSEEGSYEICPVCNWEDDPIQAEDPNYAGGANTMSLNEARKAYQEGREVEK
jgi:anaerobic ribonucleoside-triphosphate reductase